MKTLEKCFKIFQLILSDRILQRIIIFALFPLSSRFAYTNEQVKRKPGREVVTFLLVCNLAMWAINTLETNRADSHPIQVIIYNYFFSIIKCYFHEEKKHNFNIIFRLISMVENGHGQLLHMFQCH